MQKLAHHRFLDVVYVDRQWSFNGTTCARLGQGKISVLFWLDNLLSALRGEYNIHDGTQQGLCLRQLVSDEILHKLSCKIDELPDLRRAAAAPPPGRPGRGHL